LIERTPPWVWLAVLAIIAYLLMRKGGGGDDGRGDRGSGTGDGDPSG
jgi:hypothetical protein